MCDDSMCHAVLMGCEAMGRCMEGLEEDKLSMIMPREVGAGRRQGKVF